MPEEHRDAIVHQFALPAKTFTVSDVFPSLGIEPKNRFFFGGITGVRQEFEFRLLIVNQHTAQKMG